MPRDARPRLALEIASAADRAPARPLRALAAALLNLTRDDMAPATSGPDEAGKCDSGVIRRQNGAGVD
jgi:hypothetical protein